MKEVKKSPLIHSSWVSELGKGYFPFTVKETTLSPSGDRTEKRATSRYVFLTEYSESFESTWETPSIPFGRLNSDCRYVQTTRRATISFKLVARNVGEARSNLDFCEYLSRRVYGQYTQTGLVSGVDVSRAPKYRYEGATITDKIHFGNLIRNELVYFQAYAFVPNFDAGVFEYSKTPVGKFGQDNPGDKESVPLGQYQDFLGSTNNAKLRRETGWVYHRNIGHVLPKEVNVSLTLVILHDYPLGFGGSRRGDQYPYRWAENENRDWPHGTGRTYPVQRYMGTTRRPSVRTVDLGLPDENDPLNQPIEGEELIVFEVDENGLISFPEELELTDNAETPTENNVNSHIPPEVENEIVNAEDLVFDDEWDEGVLDEIFSFDPDQYENVLE